MVPRLAMRKSFGPSVLLQPIELLEGRLLLSAVTFLAPASYGAGLGATSIATADIDSDGNEDLLLAGNGGVSVLLGKGDGAFAASTTIAGTAGTTAMGTEDFSNSGNTDLVTLNSSDGSLDLLPGHGDGTFGPPERIATSAGASAMGFGDFNGDYIEDIVVAGSEGLMILTGNGDGTFAAPRTIHSGAYRGVVVDDVDWDGNDDIAATTGNSVQVFLGQGDGTFSAPKIYAGGTGASAIVADDFNDDGIDDLAVAAPGDQAVDVLFGKGDSDDDATGAFIAPISLAVGAAPTGLTSDDVDGDWNDDLIVSGPHGISVLSSNGDGTFAAPVRYGAGIGTAGVATDDFNNDGFSDLAGIDPAAGATVLIQSVPNVGVTLSAPTSVSIGGHLTYSITIQNAGPGDATGISLADSLPTGAALVSATASQGTVDHSVDGEVSVDVGDLAEGATATVTLVIQPKDFGVATNTACISSASPDADWSDNFALADTRVVGTTGADVEITQIATGGFGGPIYDPLGGGGGGVAEPGGLPGKGPIVGAASPPTPAPVAPTAPGVSGAPIATGGLIASSGPVANGISGSATTTNVASTAPIVSKPPGGAAIPIGPLPPIWWGGYVRVGDNITYTLTITNYGPQTASGLTVADTLPQNTSLVLVTPSQGTADTSTPGTVNVALGDLASGDVATITLVVKTQEVGSITNTATVSPADPASDPNSANNSSSVSRYVSDISPGPIPLPLPGPIAWSSNGAVYADGAGVSTGSSGGTGTPVGGTTPPVAAPPPASSAPAKISISNVKVKQTRRGAKNCVFTVTRAGNRATTASVDFATADNTARAGSDYVANRGTLTFHNGVKKLKVVVPLKSGTAASVKKAFTVNLSNATNASLAHDQATATLIPAHKIHRLKSGAAAHHRKQ